MSYQRWRKALWRSLLHHLQHWSQDELSQLENASTHQQKNDQPPEQPLEISPLATENSHFLDGGVAKTSALNTNLSETAAPQHWLDQISSGPPEHWLKKVREGAPSFWPKDATHLPKETVQELGRAVLQPGNQLGKPSMHQSGKEALSSPVPPRPLLQPLSQPLFHQHSGTLSNPRIGIKFHAPAPRELSNSQLSQVPPESFSSESLSQKNLSHETLQQQPQQFPTQPFFTRFFSTQRSHPHLKQSSTQPIPSSPSPPTRPGATLQPPHPTSQVSSSGSTGELTGGPNTFIPAVSHPPNPDTTSLQLPATEQPSPGQRDRLAPFLLEPHFSQPQRQAPPLHQKNTRSDRSEFESTSQRHSTFFPLSKTTFQTVHSPPQAHAHPPPFVTSFNHSTEQILPTQQSAPMGTSPAPSLTSALWPPLPKTSSAVSVLHSMPPHIRWQHLQRLEQEQQGKPWNELRF